MSAQPEPARYHEVAAKSLLRRSAVVDPFFLGRFSSNLFRGCEHGCLYCDGRAERYYVEGVFDRDIAVKANALALAERELGLMREPGFLFIGGGVCDAYQPAEQRYGLARGLLQLCREHRVPVHVLTKSSLVELDFLVRSRRLGDIPDLQASAIPDVEEIFKSARSTDG